MLLQERIGLKAVTDINAICLSSSSSVSTAAKSVNLLNAMHFIKMSWNNIAKDTIKNCSQECEFKSEESVEICEISECENECDEFFFNILILIKTFYLRVRYLTVKK